MTDNIDELLERAYESEDISETASIAKKILKLEPDNNEAILLLADTIEDNEERLELISEAIDRAYAYLKKYDSGKPGLSEDDEGVVCLALLQRASFSFFMVGDDDQALKIAEKLITYDVEDGGANRNLYYRILMERFEWSRILRETMSDKDRLLGWAYSRLIAAFMLALEGNKDAKALVSQNKMFWDTVRMSPNVPFYMLGFFPEPVDDSEEEEDAFGVAMLFEGVWHLSIDLFNWFSKNTILFGLLTDRFGSESKDMLEILNSLGGGKDYKEVKAALKNLPEYGDDDVLNCLSVKD